MEQIKRKLKMLNEEEIEDLYMWIDEIPLSRPKRNIARDFSDAGRAFPLETNVLNWGHFLIIISSCCGDH